MSAAPLRRIADCAAVLSGFSLRGRVEHDPHGTHQVILPRHVREGTSYVYSPADEMRITPEREAGHYHLRAGDVLFLGRGTRNIAVRLQSIHDPSIVSLVFHVLRAGPEVVPEYLAWYLNQTPAQAAIAQARVGSGTPLIPRQALGDIPIPIPSPSVQQRIAQLAALTSRERRLVEQLGEATRRAHRLLGEAVTHSLTAPPPRSRKRVSS